MDIATQIYIALAPSLLPIAAASLVGACGLIFKLVRDKTALKFEIDLCKASIASSESLHAKVVNDLSEDQHRLQSEYFDLQDQLRQYTDCAGLQVDAKSHTLIDPATGFHYCLPCSEKTPPERHQLEPIRGAYKCHFCRDAFNISDTSHDRYGNRLTASDISVGGLKRGGSIPFTSSPGGSQ